jgi:flagellum-specific peptidoglycan hydrolase FlgJ
MLVKKSSPTVLHRALNWLNRYWFRSVIIIIFLYAFRQKDISINFGWEEPVAVSTALSGRIDIPVEMAPPEAATATWQVNPPPPGPEREKWLRQQAYVHEYEAIARAEMRKFGIPASITLAQGLLESGAGGSRLATRNNNHFGIKCFSKTCKKGHCSNFSDDSHKDFFRIYASSAECYRAHSNLLSSGRYQHLKKYGKYDYKRWAEGLQKAGYATDPSYAKKIIQLIEDFELYYFDRE